MTGETNLSVLIASMEPELLTETYVFTVVDESQFSSLPMSVIKGFFREREGVTIIAQLSHAKDLGLIYEGEYRCLTLNVHSSLEAVGLTAAFSNALGDENISANVVAGYYHDHIFVPSRDGEKALTCLQTLAKRYQNQG
ncbi:ACT domain-containing protein [Pseudoalteromonas luteoviolacea]|nr:ACT domain-containing protein [Pseudoalteromonas luteoviolacea]KZW99119.1 hypothetical protein JL49_19210 [Pseudoalteromonas luteoviolacea]